jgi:hypothetical protein
MSDDKYQLISNFCNWCKKFNISNFVTIDPGFNTAMAYWHIAALKEGGCPHTLSFSVPSAMHKEEKIEYAWQYFEQNITHLSTLPKFLSKVDFVYIEDTQLWQESLVSVTSAARGDLLTLDKLIGGYMHMLFKDRICYNLIPARQWKGQMSKEATRLRVKREIGIDYGKNDHLHDAVGMGLSFINNWKVSK